MGQALAGMRIIDLSNFVAGAYCARILAGFGAEVVKIEKPSEGDVTRHLSPFLSEKPGVERSGLFLYLNSSKKGITLNLESRTGAKIFKELVKDADAVIESFSPGVMDRLGLDYSNLEKINSKLVMTSITSFGQTGPYRDYKLTHLIGWGMNGGRYSNGQPGVPPWQGPGLLADYMTGCFAATGTLSALYSGNMTGIGQHVDVSMFECLLFVVLHPAVMYSYLKTVYNSHARCFLGVFPCKDGYIGMNFLTLPQWEAICNFFGMPEVAEDPRFKNMALVIENLEEARTLFEAKIAEWNTQDLFQAAAEWRIPVGLIPTTKDIVESPQHKSRSFLEEVDHPVIGKVIMPGAPFKMTVTPWQNQNAAPLLGQHNQEVYCERLGYSKEDLVRLGEQGII